MFRGPLDDPGTLADYFQPGHIFVLSFSAPSGAAVGAWYLLTGLACIALGGNRAFSPWAMGIPYGAGQLLVAGILLFAANEGTDEG